MTTPTDRERQARADKRAAKANLPGVCRIRPAMTKPTEKPAPRKQFENVTEFLLWQKEDAVERHIQAFAAASSELVEGGPKRLKDYGLHSVKTALSDLSRAMCELEAMRQLSDELEKERAAISKATL
jgi:hypothetical protein